ncbi:MAG: Thioredoxin [Berkelbacteria bacterium GW2011_GWA1_36_9]|uniref:Thioredoxin n=1 Tax=Berkelbacteria bacterium GW2011_GWA1_36_9 TaxID=1618331 RepID=A0A0G0IKZ9_9BACT|nr:MAG: Thioredoxin [Berkelbacteria bacterium GW2011_GWA1_36_9]
MSSILCEFQDKDFNEFLKSKENGLALFSAPWCNACKVVTPIIEKIAQSNKKIKFIKIDVSKSPGLASRMGVMSLPNILLISKGKVAGQLIGTTTQKAIETKLKQTLERAM